MSSENKTANLELNQWSGNEYPKRTDFIEDNKKIDEAYKELKDIVKNGGKVSSVNSKIGDVILKAEDIKTAAGINVENKLNELFQFADNGKKNITSVIGSPLTTSDTFDNMKSKIQTLKNTFASNLTAKEQSSSGNENLESLINKVKNINPEKRWVEGNFRENHESQWSLDKTIKLNWKPACIVVYDYYSQFYNATSIAIHVPTISEIFKQAPNSKDYLYSQSASGAHGMCTITMISDVEFRLTVWHQGSYQFYWLAIEL